MTFDVGVAVVAGDVVVWSICVTFEKDSMVVA